MGDQFWNSLIAFPFVGNLSVNTVVLKVGFQTPPLVKMSHLNKSDPRMIFFEDIVVPWLNSFAYSDFYPIYIYKGPFINLVSIWTNIAEECQ